jgi:hypothetical protein
VDAQIKQKWIEALRSGNYEQTTGSLREGNRYCCLGVLCAIQGSNFQEFPELETGELTSDDEDNEYDYSAGLTSAQCIVLTDMNDGLDCEPRSFDHIAGYIQAMIAEDLT